MQVYSLFQNTLHPKKVEVELHTRFQIPSFHILGLPAPEIQEARERVAAAFLACGFEFPKKKVIINLTPSSERKCGTGHDLAIAIKILSDTLELNWPKNLFAWGELGLDGKLKSCGHLAKWVELLLKEGIQDLILCEEDRNALLELFRWRKQHGLSVPKLLNLYVIQSLDEIQDFFEFKAKRSFEVVTAESLQDIFPKNNQNRKDYSLLPLSPHLERVIQIAMVGRHHLLILGPKGMGKSQALEWIGHLSPSPAPLQTWERILQSEHAREKFSFDLPVRRVHANIRDAHLLGSWLPTGFSAGELSRAHGGILIADEFLEWPRDAKECLREPLEQKKYSLIRKQGKVSLSCDLQFVGTGNLCPCGGMPSSFRSMIQGDEKSVRFPHCRCMNADVHRYLAKLSGPISDRIDLVLIHAERPSLKKNSSHNSSTSKEMREQIFKARTFAVKKFGALPSELGVEWLEKNLSTALNADSILGNVPSLRSRHKILRLSRSIQALEQSSELRVEHIWEAAGYRFEGVPGAI